jgi:hypothetical protein
VSALQRKLALILQATSGVDSDRQVLAVVLPLGEVLNVLEVAKCPSEQVCRHDWCALEAHNLVSCILTLLGLLLRHVGQRGQVFGHFHFEVESGFEVGLVEAREGTAGVGRFELCREHVVVLVILGHALCRFDGGVVLGTVEASHGIVHGALECDRQDSLLGLRKLLVEGEGAALVLLIVADVGGFDARSSLAGIESNLGRVKLELVGVEGYRLGGFLYSKIDCYATLVCPWRVRLEIEEGDVVVGRLDTAKKSC